MDQKKQILKSIESIRSIISRNRSPDDSLLSGNLGLVIYHSCLGKIFDDEKDITLSVEIFEEIFDKIKESSSTLKTYQYSNGLSGLGVVTHFMINEDIIDLDIDEDLELIDEFIYEKALEQINNAYVEFLHGGSGTLHYFNQRHPTKKITKYKENLVTAILKQIELDPLQVRIPRSQFIWTKNDDYDLSLSHGLCGVTLVLLSVIEKGDVRNGHLIRSYLERVAKFVVNLKRQTKKEEGNLSFFPSYLAKQLTGDDIREIEVWENSRLAWCYGDLGWVLFFYRYGEFTGNSAFSDLADEIGIYTTSRQKPHETDSNSTHICHGHSGLALFYKRLHVNSNKEEYKIAYQYWVNETLKTLTLELKDGTFSKRAAETSLLEGLAGINMVLSSCVNDRDCNWENLLLL